MSCPSPHTPWLGGDGLFTFLLSNIVLVGSLGLTGLFALRRTWRYARHTPSSIQCDLLLVAGMRLNRYGQPSPDYRRRLGRALALYRTGRCRRLLLLGGETRPGAPSEAQAGRYWLRAEGVPDSAILLEERSRHTLENLTEARLLLRTMAAVEGRVPRLGLVSSRYHLARIAALAAGLSLSPPLCAAEAEPFFTPVTWARIGGEAYYLHWYHVGRIWSQLTGNKGSLARIS